MLLAGPETAAPDIHVPLQMDGSHAISIGVMPARTVAEGGGLELDEIHAQLLGDGKRGRVQLGRGALCHTTGPECVLAHDGPLSRL